MAFLYIKALHIIFVVTWFAGLFYVVRLFIYNREALDRPDGEREILQKQFTIMIRRLWLGIAWPSCILAVISGSGLLFLYSTFPVWLWIKLGFVAGLLLYHSSLHILYNQQRNGIFRYSSQQLRIWNEVATIFLVAIVMLIVIRSGIGLLWGIGGLIGFVILIMSGVSLYKRNRRG